jgi:hypothetical protein
LDAFGRKLDERIVDIEREGWSAAPEERAKRRSAKYSSNSKSPRAPPGPRHETNARGAMANAKRGSGEKLIAVPPDATMPYPDAAVPEKRRTDAFQKLLEAANAWTDLCRASAGKSDEPERKEALAVARVLNATMGALLQENGDEIDALETAAQGALGREQNLQLERSETLMLALPLELGGFAFPLVDIDPASGPGPQSWERKKELRILGRPGWVQILQDTLSDPIELFWRSSHSNDMTSLAQQLTEAFLSVIESPLQGAHVLRSSGRAGKLPAGARGKVREKFQEILEANCGDNDSDEIAKLMIIRGMVAIGVKRENAKSLFDWEERRKARRGTRG